MLGKISSKKEIPALIACGHFLTNTIDKANYFAKKFVEVSSSNNYDNEYKKHKSTVEEQEINTFLKYYKENQDCFNEKFTLQEFKDAISDTNDSSPGKDKTSYSMFRHLSDKTLNIFFCYF